MDGIQNYLEANLTHIEQRWPALHARLVAVAEPDELELIEAGVEPTLMVHGIHLTSCFDRKGEARLQATLVPETAKSAWLYGVASGDLQRELLKRVELEQLDVVILSIGLFKSCLKYFDHQDWLADGRVRLDVAEAGTDLRTPFCAVPACLKLADQAAARLRDLIVLELETEYINSKVRNNSQFLQQIQDNIALLQQDNDVQALFGTRRGASCYVAAAGPTLSEHYQRLSERDQDLYLIAVDAAVKPLLAHEIVPDIVVSIDGIRDHIMALLDVDFRQLAGIPLVYFPIVHRDVLERWPGPRYTAYSSSPLYEELLQQYPKGMLYASGTVLHAAVDLAVKMGHTEIRLLGADFSFPRDKSHVDDAVFCQPIDQSISQEWVVDGSGKQVRTSKNLRGYLRDLERYIAQHPQVRFINGSHAGAMIEGAEYSDL